MVNMSDNSLVQSRGGARSKIASVMPGAAFAFDLLAVAVGLALLLLVGVMLPGLALQTGPSGGQNPFFWTAFAVFLLVIVVVRPIVDLVILRVGLARAALGSLVVHNLPAVEAVIQSAQEVPSHGEGLADALDVGGF